MSVEDIELFSGTLLPSGVPMTAAAAEALIAKEYGIEARAERLTGERDENLRMRVENGAGYVLKIAHAREPAEITDLSLTALLHLEKTAPHLPLPRVIRTLGGQTQVRFTDDSGALRTGSLYTFLPGDLLLSSTRSREQRRNCGRLLAELARALRHFEHTAARRMIPWDLAQLPRLASLLPKIASLDDAAFFAHFVAKFTTDVAPRLTKVRQQFIHNDFNSRNILVDPTEPSRVTGIIDFGDAVHTALVADVAVGVMGQLAHPDTAEESIGDFVQAYCEEEPLTTDELALINWLIAGRIVQNVVITSWHRVEHPNDKHFEAFDATYFKWRVALAKRLTSLSHCH